MKLLHTLFLMAGGALLCTSCDSYLDIKPKGVTIPEYFEDFNRLMNHRQLMAIDDINTIYLSDDVEVGEDSMKYGDIDKKLEGPQNLYKFAPGAVYPVGGNDLFYENAYKRMYTYNVIVNHVDECPDGSETDKQGLIAKARFTRAFEYLMLVNAYAKAYDPATADKDLGVPVVLSTSISDTYERNTVAEVYKQILSDLEYAETYLPDKAISYYFPDKRSVYALYARTYLYMGNYEKARDYAEKVMLSEDPLIDLNEYTINPDKSKWGLGRIWNKVTETTYPQLDENNPEVILFKDLDIMGLSRNVFVSKDLLEVFKHDLPEGSVDQRRNLFTVDNFFMCGTVPFYFDNKTLWVAYCDWNGGLNYQEAMLTLAECYARLNMTGQQPDGLDKAYNLLDRLRNKRITNNQPLPHKDAQSALLTVLEERRRELAFYGSLRLFDLKRLNKEEAFKKT